MTNKNSQPKRRGKKRSSTVRILLTVFITVFCVAAIVLTVCLIHISKSRSDFQKLAEIVRQNTPETVAPVQTTLPAIADSSAEPAPSAATTLPTQTAAPDSSEPTITPAVFSGTASAVTTLPPSTPVPTVPAEPEPTKPVMLPQYVSLYQRNPDLFGWLRIEDTVIDYPIMYSPDEPGKYLHANFAGEYSYPGIPFVDDACTADSDNLLIYGHNMHDGSMFHSLMKYRSKSYWQSHPLIHFDTLYETGEYEVLAAFYDRVYYRDEDCFKFYQFIDAEDEADFDNAISNFQSKALYDTGVTAAYGDKLITLVTCSYHVEDGRFVVVARKK